MLATILAAACATTALGAADPGGAAFGTRPAGQVGNAALHAPAGALLGREVRFGGTLAPGTRVRIQRRDPGAAWTTAATTRAAADGAYGVAWTADHPGPVEIRAVAGNRPPHRTQARSATAAPSIRLTVFNPARATWFGPGFFGHRTACGQRLTRTLVGVAHRSLPCGTKVSVYYRGRTLRLPVVDRGPYGTGARWDLTAAAAQRLGFTGSDSIGVLATAHAGKRRGS